MGRAPLPTKVCANCGELFAKSAQWSARQWAARRFCSQACTGAAASIHNAATRPTIRETFEARFSRTDGCWLWTGTIDGYGYGVLDHNGKRYRAHVLALEYDGRPVAPGGVACHHCDNPPCVNPSHLYPGTPADNARDALSRGHTPRGTSHGRAKLTEGDVREIRRIRLPAAQIARIYGVSRPTVRRVQTRRGWGHVQ